MHSVGLVSIAAARARSLLGILARMERQARGAAILVYHGVVPEIVKPDVQEYGVDVATFREHLAFLKRRWQPVPLRQIVDALQSGAPIEPSWVAVTLDDGLENQTTLAAEVLRDHAIPWALSLPTAMIGSDRAIWSYELTFLLLDCWRGATAPTPPNLSGPLPTETYGQRLDALRAIKSSLIQRADPESRGRYLEALIDEFGRSEFSERLRSFGVFKMAGWDAIRTLASDGVEMIAHGHRHCPLNDMLDASQLALETRQPKDEIQARLGVVPSGFALPGGVSSRRVLQAVEEAGYGFCLTSATGRVTEQADVHNLPRVDAEYPLAVLRRHMLTVETIRSQEAGREEGPLP